MLVWFDIHSGFLSFMAVLILVFITGYYALQTRKQANYAHKTLEEENNKTKNTALNYAYLINSEMMAHQSIFANYLFERGKFVDTAVAFYNFNFQGLELNTWNIIKTEIPKYFHSRLMQELVGYYSGIELMTSKQLNDEQKFEFVEYQFASMYKCINLLEAEFKIELRKRNVYTYNNCIVKINTKNGEFTVDYKN